MRFSSEDVVWQEVPGEVSLAYVITGCPVGCKGCHSVDTWPADRGEVLTQQHLVEQLDRYQGLLTCLCFMGGEWYPEDLIQLLEVARQRQLKTCLYTGLHDVPLSIKKRLTYLKTGPWRPERGGLDQPGTNQLMVDLRTNEILNHKFRASQAEGRIAVRNS